MKELRKIEGWNDNLADLANWIQVVSGTIEADAGYSKQIYEDADNLLTSLIARLTEMKEVLDDARYGDTCKLPPIVHAFFIEHDKKARAIGEMSAVGFHDETACREIDDRMTYIQQIAMGIKMHTGAARITEAQREAVNG